MGLKYLLHLNGLHSVSWLKISLYVCENSDSNACLQVSQEGSQPIKSPNTVIGTLLNLINDAFIVFAKNMPPGSE